MRSDSRQKIIFISRYCIEFCEYFRFPLKIHWFQSQFTSLKFRLIIFCELSGLLISFHQMVHLKCKIVIIRFKGFLVKNGVFFLLLLTRVLTQEHCRSDFSKDKDNFFWNPFYIQHFNLLKKKTHNLSCSLFTCFCGQGRCLLSYSIVLMLIPCKIVLTWQKP